MVTRNAYTSDMRTIRKIIRTAATATIVAGVVSIIVATSPVGGMLWVTIGTMTLRRVGR